jgi:hypothetical protein
MNRLARSLGVLGLAGAAALTACHDDHATEQAPSPTKLSETPAAAEPATPPAVPAAPGAPAAPAADAAAGGVVWKDMKREEREHYMKTVVVPTMKPLFAKWSPDEFGDIRCATCHGASAKDKTFKMPNPKLPRLPTDEAGWKALEAKEPEAVKFMREVVVPTMAQMLGEKPYDPATKEVFGCFECHTAKK